MYDHNNDIPPQLHLRKVVVNETAERHRCGLRADCGNGTGAKTSRHEPGRFGCWTAGRYVRTSVITSPGGYTASAWVCVGGTQNGSNITVGLGQSATCTITNNDIHAAVYICEGRRQRQRRNRQPLRTSC
jgi:hypothetical protein